MGEAMSALGTFQKLFDMIGGVRAKRDLTGGINLVGFDRLNLANLMRQGGVVKIAAAGDSITYSNRNTVTDGHGWLITDRPVGGFLNHMESLTGGRLMLGSILAQSGATTQQIYDDAVEQNWFASITDPIVMWFTGANDLFDTNLTAAQLFANLMTIRDAIRAAGKIPVFGTIFPRTEGATNTTPQVNLRLGANALLRAERDAGRLLLADWDYLFQTSAGSVITDSLVTYDGVHPAVMSCEAMGQILCDLLLQGSAQRIAPSQWSPVGAIFPRISNAPLAGSGGTADAGVTGTVPASWIVQCPSGAAVVTKVASVDVDPLEWLQIEVTSPVGSAGYAHLMQLITKVSGPIEVCAELEVDGVSSSVLGFGINIAQFSTPHRKAYAMNDLVSAGLPITAKKRWLKTGKIDLNGTDNVAVYFFISVAQNKVARLRVRRIAEVSVDV